MNPYAWLILPLVGALIGYATNWIAVRLLFWPKQPILGVQGLLPRRQDEFAATVASVVGSQLVEMDEMLACFDDLDLRSEVGPLFDQLAEAKIEKLRNTAFIGELITDERIAEWKEEFIEEVERQKPKILAHLKFLAYERIDVEKLAHGKMTGQNIERLEVVVKTIARKEFRAIECAGAVLGLIIGLIQAAILQALS